MAAGQVSKNEAKELGGVEPIPTIRPQGWHAEALSYHYPVDFGVYPLLACRTLASVALCLQGVVHSFPQRRIWPAKEALTAPGLLPHCRPHTQSVIDNSQKPVWTRTKCAFILHKTAATMGVATWSLLRIPLFVRSNSASRTGKNMLTIC
jgi:hypothetical protein